MTPFTVLVIGRANAARDVAAAEAMRQRLAQLADTCPVTVITAGTDVVAASPTGQPLTPELVEQAGLVLGVDRGRRAKAARIWPPARTRLFTLTQAAELAARTGASLAQGRLPQGAPPLPTQPHERLAWFVAELDAARALIAGWRHEEFDIPEDDGSRAARKGLERARTDGARLAAALCAVASGAH